MLEEQHEDNIKIFNEIWNRVEDCIIKGIDIEKTQDKMYLEISVKVPLKMKL